ncbi:dTDP-4-dehydrorhamnose reductase [Gilvimarinus sp. DA14]|uniref:dTDP-4-dehydrorhamnose reductase n=1 Tax=Gilvimarinus sp. DA14 TaxID=2956798 RepID=UPI0020B746A4|nr:dTDP-4-dehydrorhamnose reductase [Gilvimarinus sp. DA14]UTF59843.1 dTDP-4-dehydrorhamnose reductase [Gilvimarinus sp. DA14]
MHILVLGAGGQVGQELQRLASQSAEQWTFFDRQTLDLSKIDAIRPAICKARPDVIINCAAYTAVDKAEEERESADLINHLAVAELARAAQELDACLIHISTDYVFDGKHYRPYRPGDQTNPQGQYGATKLAGERAFIDSGAKGIIVRTSWVYSAFGKNFVGTMLRLGSEKDHLNVVADQIGSPTWAKDLAVALIAVAQSPALSQQRATIYHYSNAGVCSWYDFATCIMQRSGKACVIHPIPSEAFPTPAKRPHFSVLDCREIEKDFYVLRPHWLDSLNRALAEYTH